MSHSMINGSRMTEVRLAAVAINFMYLLDHSGRKFKDRWVFICTTQCFLHIRSECHVLRTLCCSGVTLLLCSIDCCTARRNVLL